MCCMELGTAGRAPPALPGHVSAARRASLLILFLFSSPLLKAFPADTYLCYSPVQGISSMTATDFVSRKSLLVEFKTLLYAFLCDLL